MEFEQLRLDIDKTYPVVQDNSFIMGNYSMSSMEQKIFLIMLSCIKKDDTEIKPTSFRVLDLSELMEVSPQVLYRDLKKMCKSLMSKIFEVKKPNGDWHIFNIIKSAKYSNKKGLVTIKINEEAYPYLLELKELFTSFKLENALNLDGKYAIRIYQQAKSNIFKGEYIVKLDDFKKQLGLKQKSYNQFSNINLKVLTPAKQEINFNTDISINIEPIKIGRKVEALKFIVKNKRLKKVTKSNSSNKSNEKYNSFKDYEQRKYSNEDLEVLERKLLGWD